MYKKIIRARLSKRTWEIRADLGWSQEQMSERLRITPRAYGDLERGRYCFSSSALLFLLELMGKDASWELVSVICAEIAGSEGKSGGLGKTGSALPCETGAERL